MAGKTYFLLLAVAVVVQATTPQIRDQILSVNGKLADPANLRQSLGAADLPRVNGIDSALLYTPSKDGTVSPFFSQANPANLATIVVVMRYPSAANYHLFLAREGADCQVLTPVAATGIDTNIFASGTGVASPLAADGTQTFTFPIITSSTPAFAAPPAQPLPGNDWNSRFLDLNTFSRKICLATGVTPAFNAGPPITGTVSGATSAKWTGATLRTAFDCDLAPQRCSSFVSTKMSAQPLSVQQAYSTSVRTQCCTAGSASLLTPGWRIGVCINPKVQSCCGQSASGPALEVVQGQIRPGISKCCNKANELLVDDVSPCPCRSQNAQPTLPVGVPPAINSDCADLGTNSRCCLPSPTRYPELTRTDLVVGETVIVQSVWGSCFDVTDPVWKCCATGQLYNSGVSRCCVVGGVQPLDTPCSCSTDAHCADNTRCCTASNPDRPIPREADRCSIYQSYPFNPRNVQSTTFGASPQLPRTDLQNCYGTCINPNFQSCCNGVVCMRAYEKCCNSTCCNKFSETCIEGQRSGSSQFNTNSFRTTFYTCSSIELLTVLRSGMIYIIPLALLIATFGGLGVVLVFANKASNRSYSFIESTMIVLALVSALSSIPLFFSPMFKYAVFIIIASLISILSAAARVKIVNIFAIIAQVVILFYIFDPIHGNRFLTFTSFPQISGANSGLPDTETKGLLHTTTSLFYRNGVVDTSFCTNFYDYFNLDRVARDTTRFDNPDINTFGYCKRGWIAFLLIFEGILIVAFVLLFVVSLISLLLRFRKAVNLAPITLEILKEDAPFTPVPLY